MISHTLRLLAFLGLLIAYGVAEATPAAAPGGQGTLTPAFNQTQCMPVRGETLNEVCVRYSIAWRLWTLMGEPVAISTLQWDLVSIRLTSQTRKASKTYTASAIPSDLSTAVSKLELFIEGDAIVTSKIMAPGQQLHFHLDTGTAVRARAGHSLNTPGSPSWDKVFYSAIDRCNARTYTYLPAAGVKDAFRTGIQLQDFTACPGSGISNAEAVEDAIHRICAQRPSSPPIFCPLAPIPPTPAIADGTRQSAMDALDQLTSSAGRGDSTRSGASALDERAARPAVLKRLQQDRASYRLATEPACRKSLDSIEACYVRAGCRMQPNLPTSDTCKTIPPYPNDVFGFHLTAIPKPGDLCYREDAECLRARAEYQIRKDAERAERREQQRTWDERYGHLSKQCRESEEARTAVATCRSNLTSTCNALHIDSMDDCLDRMTKEHGPSESDAQRHLQEDTKKPQKSLRDSILD